MLPTRSRHQVRQALRFGAFICTVGMSFAGFWGWVPSGFAGFFVAGAVMLFVHWHLGRRKDDTPPST